MFTDFFKNFFEKFFSTKLCFFLLYFLKSENEGEKWSKIFFDNIRAEYKKIKKKENNTMRPLTGSSKGAKCVFEKK